VTSVADLNPLADEAKPILNWNRPVWPEIWDYDRNSPLIGRQNLLIA
jgi:hypothetical protein